MHSPSRRGICVCCDISDRCLASCRSINIAEVSLEIFRFGRTQTPIKDKPSHISIPNHQLHDTRQARTRGPGLCPTPPSGVRPHHEDRRHEYGHTLGLPVQWRVVKMSCQASRRGWRFRGPSVPRRRGECADHTRATDKDPKFGLGNVFIVYHDPARAGVSNLVVFCVSAPLLSTLSEATTCSLATSDQRLPHGALQYTRLTCKDTPQRPSTFKQHGTHPGSRSHTSVRLEADLDHLVDGERHVEHRRR